jgi:hypothetical protein
MQRRYLLLALSLILIACSSGPGQEQIEATAKAGLTEIAPPPVTIISLPTAVPPPAETPRPTTHFDEVRQNLLNAIMADVSKYSGVKSVTQTRFNKGVLEIELSTKWTSQESQPDVSFAAIQALADSFATYDRDVLEYLAEGVFKIHLTTRSSTGDYRYQSVTDWDTLKNLANRAISREEWVRAAGAAFK